MTSTSVTLPLKKGLLQSICNFIDKEVFHYESQKSEEWIPCSVACDDKTKIVIKILLSSFFVTAIRAALGGI